MKPLFFEDWASLGRTVLMAVLAYAALVLVLRATGKRTLSKWNAFDLVVTVALGSSLATVMLSKQVPLLEGILAFTVLVLLQFGVTWLSVRSRWMRRVVKAEPTLLVHRGTMRDEALRRERVPRAEVDAALRSQGIASIEDVDAVVLETDGSFSVIKRLAGSGSAMEDVQGYDVEPAKTAEAVRGRAENPGAGERKT